MAFFSFKIESPMLARALAQLASAIRMSAGHYEFRRFVMDQFTQLETSVQSLGNRLTVLTGSNERLIAALTIALSQVKELQDLNAPDAQLRLQALETQISSSLTEIEGQISRNAQALGETTTPNTPVPTDPQPGQPMG